MSSWKSERRLQWQPVKLWWTPCPRGLRQRCKIMVATQNINFLCLICTFSLWPAVETLMAVCWVILRGQQIYTVRQAVHSLFYIVAKCHFFSVVTWKDIIKYLKKCEGCTPLCDILYIYMNQAASPVSKGLSAHLHKNASTESWNPALQSA